MTDPTPGQAALAEVARLETARIYGRTCPEHKQREQPGRRGDVSMIEQAIARGRPTLWIMDAFGATYRTVKTIRDEMRGASRKAHLRSVENTPEYDRIGGESKRPNDACNVAGPDPAGTSNGAVAMIIAPPSDAPDQAR